MQKKIGCNRSTDYIHGGFVSSFNGSFDGELVAIETGIMDIVYCQIGDISDAYEMLKKKIADNNATDFYDICNLVYETIHEYFGGIDHISDRMKYYIPDDEIGSEENKVSNLRGKGAAMCVERAMLAQNLLKSLNINSYYKDSGIIRNGEKEIHAYNLVEYNGEYFIFDASIPNLINGKVSPIIGKIPKDVFELISSPEIGTGCAVITSHYNPLRDMDVTIKYDSGRKKVYTISEDNSLKK